MSGRGAGTPRGVAYIRRMAEPEMPHTATAAGELAGDRSTPAGAPVAAAPPGADPQWARRYARQLALPELGVDGQRRLARARVLVVGVGGLGSLAALSLASMGVGTLGLADFDTVELSNLHRQLLYTAADVGRLKVEAARDRIAAAGTGAQLHVHPTAIDERTADAIVAGYDLVVDGTDALPVRYALSDACVRHGRPLVHGSVSRFEGRVTLLAAPNGPCYRCLWPAPPTTLVASCAEAGVLGAVPNVVAMLQATEAAKWIAAVGTPLVGRLLVLDLLGVTTHTIAVERNPLCPVCGGGQIAAPRRPAAPELSVAPPAAPPSVTAMTPDHPAAPADGGEIPELTPAEVAARLARPEPPTLVDVREPWEHQLAHIEGARFVPLGALGAALSTFDPEADYVLLCHHGVRSLAAARFLRERGLRRVANLAGGIDAWSVDVDPAVPRY